MDSVPRGFGQKQAKDQLSCQAMYRRLLFHVFECVAREI